MRKDVEKVVDDIGVAKHLKGYECVIRAVEKSAANSNLGITEIYRIVANEIGCSPARVERNIRHAIRWLLTRCDNERIVNYFGNSYRVDGKITNKQFISTLAVASIRVHWGEQIC